MAPKAPPGLASGGRALWRAVAATGDLRPDHRRILLDCCFEIDLIDALQDGFKGEPHTVRGSQGQIVAHPVISELRMHRATLNTLLRGLSLASSDTRTEDAGRAASEGAMALAKLRWSKKAGA